MTNSFKCGQYYFSKTFSEELVDSKSNYLLAIISQCSKTPNWKRNYDLQEYMMIRIMYVLIIYIS